MTINAMAKDELEYAYSPLEETEKKKRGRMGLIGHLRADMDSDENGFFSSFFDSNPALKTPDFKNDLQRVIEALRKNHENAFLRNRKALMNFCYGLTEYPVVTAFSEDVFGVRVDTKEYVYMMRLNPNKGEYNLYCYCYKKDLFQADA